MGTKSSKSHLHVIATFYVYCPVKKDARTISCWVSWCKPTTAYAKLDGINGSGSSKEYYTSVKKSELEIAVVVESVDIRRIFKNSPNSMRIFKFFPKMKVGVKYN
jgi:hypothetical protein